MRARSLMLLRTASHGRKSVMTAAFCRIFARREDGVAPVKAQNAALNSAATIDGYEIGQEQALQVKAAYQAPTRVMNPILLKPDSDHLCRWRPVVGLAAAFQLMNTDSIGQNHRR